jgi:hypothetical protein
MERHSQRKATNDTWQSATVPPAPEGGAFMDATDAE